MDMYEAQAGEGSTKRPSDGEGSGSEKRPKTGKRTTRACNECKEHKVKCVVAKGKLVCQRCIEQECEEDCVFGSGPFSEREQIKTLSKELETLRDKVTQFSDALNQPNDDRSSTATTAAISVRGTSMSARRRSLRSQSGREHQNRAAPPPTLEAKYWETCTAEELTRLLTLFQAEVESMYPLIKTHDLIGNATEILECIKAPVRTGQLEHVERVKAEVSRTNIKMIKVSVAIAMVLEDCGKTEVTKSIVESVELSMSSISRLRLDLKEIQLLTLLSAYYHYSDNEPVAWRTIGVAARAALEIGLHRESSLIENFPDDNDRQLAIRAFWCIYVLDKIWSFELTLPCALNDREMDLDPGMPEPDVPYLKAMVGYSRLCSKLWETKTPYGSKTKPIPSETVDSLVCATTEWFESLPPNLQFRRDSVKQDSSGLNSPVPQLPGLLCYLRANHARTLIRRYDLISCYSNDERLQNAQLVVDVALDTLSVLVDLYTNSADICTGQQSVLNYFLVSALVVVLVAVLNGPRIFAIHCRKGFVEGVDLMKKKFNRESAINRKLLTSIRDLLQMAVESNIAEMPSPEGSAASMQNELLIIFVYFSDGYAEFQGGDIQPKPEGRDDAFNDHLWQFEQLWAGEGEATEPLYRLI